jgi:hypothetical protein
MIRNVVTMWGSEISEKDVKLIGKKFYCFELNRIRTEYRKKGRIDKI